MPRIIFISAEGDATTVEADEGVSLMQAATAALVRGVVAECGGCLSCATCHVYIDDAWYQRLPAREELEEEMLVMALDPGPTSRLSCQVRLSTELDGMVIRVPARQF